MGKNKKAICCRSYRGGDQRPHGKDAKFTSFFANNDAKFPGEGDQLTERLAC